GGGGLGARGGIGERHQAEGGDQDQQRGERGDEPGVGGVGDQPPAVIVPVLLDQPDDKRWRLVPLLQGIGPANRLFDWVHRPPPSAPRPLTPACPPAPPTNTY